MPNKPNFYLIPFTCASAKDRIKVTVKLSELDLGFGESFANILDKGESIVLDMLSGTVTVPVIFTVNRAGSTAATNSWPICFRKPEVGIPVRCKVARAKYIHSWRAS